MSRISKGCHNKVLLAWWLKQQTSTKVPPEASLSALRPPHCAPSHPLSVHTPVVLSIGAHRNRVTITFPLRSPVIANMNIRFSVYKFWVDAIHSIIQNTDLKFPVHYFKIIASYAVLNQV